MTPNAYDLLDTKPELVLYRNLWSLFRAMTTHLELHPGTVFLCADRPKERCIGFWDGATQTGWHIGLGSLVWDRTGYDVRALFFSRQRRVELAAELALGQFPTPSTISVANPPECA